VSRIIEAGGGSVHALRDATRGGVAAVLNEFAVSSKVGIRIQEKSIPVLPAVAGACGLLGLDPLYVANEGKLVASVSADKAEEVLSAMRAHQMGKNAVIIGEVTAEQPAVVTMQTLLGSWRIVDIPLTEQLPRIC
jgi:hydrogenase expression/formation protein HypE